MPGPGWVISTEGTSNLLAATARTALNVVGASGKDMVLCEMSVNFDGTTSGNAPVYIELCRSTQATAGTSTAVTARRARGVSTATFAGTAAKNYTVEPTVLTVIKDWAIDPNKGVFVIQFPLGREPSQDGAAGLALRLTAAQTVNYRAYMEVEIS